MSLRDYRAIKENVQGLVAITPHRKKFKFCRSVLPKRPIANRQRWWACVSQFPGNQ